MTVVGVVVALRSLEVHHDECTIFTWGVGHGFKGNIHPWELSNMNCTSGYCGHEEKLHDSNEGPDEAARNGAYPRI